MKIIDYRKWLRDSGKSEGTVQRYLETIRDWRRQRAATGLGMVSYARRHQERYQAGEISASRYNGILSALESWQKWAGTNRQLPPRVKINMKPQLVIDSQDTAKLLAALSKQTYREQAAIWLLYSAGLRREELITALLENLDLENQILTVKGKGGKWRSVPFDEHTATLLKAYLRLERKAKPKTRAKNVPPETIFTGNSGGEYSAQIITSTIRAAARDAGLEDVAGTNRPAHLLRRCCATHMLENGASLEQLQDLLGHDSINTTKLYAKLSPKILSKAHRSYHPLSQTGQAKAEEKRVV